MKQAVIHTVLYSAVCNVQFTFMFKLVLVANVFLLHSTGSTNLFTCVNVMYLCDNCLDSIEVRALFILQFKIVKDLNFTVPLQYILYHGHGQKEQYSVPNKRKQGVDNP
jgi:hypothetical protein